MTPRVCEGIESFIIFIVGGWWQFTWHWIKTQFYVWVKVQKTLRIYTNLCGRFLLSNAEMLDFLNGWWI
jgi:hypothetical protein